MQQESWKKGMVNLMECGSVLVVNLALVFPLYSALLANRPIQSKEPWRHCFNLLKTPYVLVNVREMLSAPSR